ncbi:MAG: hypothetical protein ACFNVI_08435 [Lachnoanaerobaculum gingivalis]|nr:MAG TPA: hypothetical protein [Caudoviricetes sp.]DAM74363.1 MAG TPA: hypothetical protein [Caudoviricetes sp.]DAP99707.1 MAG TPA: hypothetical protein [Caudoviricetes sp.]DAS84469.1 MAG TPA: hypothetical protein [Caudoviricetes sp.]
MEIVILWVDKITGQFFKMDGKPSLKEDVENFDCIEVNEEAFNKYEKMKAEGHILVYKAGKIKIQQEIFDRNLKTEQIKKELSELKVEYSEKEFIFKGKYLQKNREKGDRDSLTSLILLLTITGRKETNEWKLIDKDTREHVYPTLTLDDFKLMAFHMQSQLSKAIKTESEIISKLKTLTDEELKKFNAREEFEKLWN